MKIVSIECPNCNANLDIDSSRKDCYCQYCGTHLFLDDGTVSTKKTLELKWNNAAKVKELELQKQQHKDLLDLERREREDKLKREQDKYKTRRIVKVLDLIFLVCTALGFIFGRFEILVGSLFLTVVLAVYLFFTYLF